MKGVNAYGFEKGSLASAKGCPGPWRTESEFWAPTNRSLLIWEEGREEACVDGGSGPGTVRGKAAEAAGR